MEIKGTGIKTTRDFVKTNFPSGFEKWIETLPEKTRALYAPPALNLAGWFPIKEGYLVPMEKIVELFYDSDKRVGGEALGRFSAQLALTGIYKLFLMVATPRYLMQRASTILSTYYIPCELKVSENHGRSITIIVTKFPDISKILEYRIAGWCIQALEMCGCKNVHYTMPLSISDGDSQTEFVFEWN